MPSAAAVRRKGWAFFCEKHSFLIEAYPVVAKFLTIGGKKHVFSRH